MNARELLIKFTLHRLSCVSKRVFTAASAGLHRARYRAGEAHATCGSDQTCTYSWISDVDDYGSVVT